MLLRALLAFVSLLAPPQVTARVATGLNPCGAVAGMGAVWTANDGSGTLARIDPRTNRVTRRVKTGSGSCSVAIGAGALWVTNYRAKSLVRVNPRTFRVRSVRLGGTPFDVVVANDHVFVTTWDASTLVELDAKSMRVIRRLAVGPYPTGLHLLAGALWVGFGRGATAIVRVDLRTGTVERVAVGVKAPSWFAAGTPDLWITADDDALVHVDPEARRVVSTTRMGFTLAQPALAPDGTIWVPDKQVDKIFRVDAATGQVLDSFAAGDGAFAVLRAFGSMWVTSYAGADVWRFAVSA